MTNELRLISEEKRAEMLSTVEMISQSTFQLLIIQFFIKNAVI